jgi:hypothetical protein
MGEGSAAARHFDCGSAIGGRDRRCRGHQAGAAWICGEHCSEERICIYNQRPHEALDMRCPAEVYQPSTQIYSGLQDIDYPLHDKTIVVTRCGRICLGKKKINFSTVFAGQAVGIKEVHDDIWLVSFMNYDLGYFDLETRVLEPLENPFGPKVLPMS